MNDFFIFIYLELAFHYVLQAGLELKILQYWDCRYVTMPSLHEHFK
jgi:hypothetical protein